MKFTLTWKNFNIEKPTESNRYWCIVEEQNSLGKSTFQWNCYYDINNESWSDKLEYMRVIWWTELAPYPIK